MQPIHRRFILLSLCCLVFIIPATAQRKKTEPRIRVSSRSIERGDTVDVSWKIGKARRVEIEGISEELPLEGSLRIMPEKDTLVTFHFTIRKNKIISKKRMISVTVPEITRFSVPESATDEETVRISWRTENASYVLISGIPDTLRPSGTLDLQLDTSAVFSLVACGKYACDSSGLKPIHIRQIENCTEAVKAVYRGESVQIQWKTKLSDGVYINLSDSLYPPVGELTLYPRQDTVCHLLVKRRYGVIDTLGSIPLKVWPPRIAYFRGPSTIIKGEQAILEWYVAGGDGIRIEGIADNLSHKGYIAVKPDKYTHYCLRVKDGEEEIVKEIEVNVYPFRKFISATRNISDVPPGEEIVFDILEVDRSSYPDSIRLKVIAVDEEGHYISGLSASELSSRYFRTLTEILANRINTCTFKVREIQETASAPYDISMVLDYSGSMSHVIKFMENAARDFISKKYIEDRIAYTKFDDKIITMSALTKNKSSLLSRVGMDGLKGFGGTTALYAASNQGLLLLDSINRHQVLILLTDGYENASLRYFGTYVFTANQLAKLLREKDVKLFIISYGLGTNFELLVELAAMGNGMFYPIFNPGDIQKVFDELPRVLHQYYEISYKPVEKSGYHKVELNYYSGTEYDRTNYHYYIGDDFDLTPYEFGKDNYWYRELNGKKPVSTPQVVANFAFNDDFLIDKYIQNLEKYCQYLDAYPEAELDILAHADNVGTREQCHILTDRRCARVKEYFLKQGIAEERIHTRSFGKDEPLWTSEQYDWQASENRRVELIILE